ncbi:SpoIVB peptidase [Halalkalibacter hemicellulosilyticus]|uniref:Stage IV sporulation protein B n=1 Tax=Halalkalibacter hemicellulosilyticusJCM 9152 TaxID=1236971 RepID=W4QKM0_9BACI|nr:SpoIVB peptidase [Halalkalibacter hemicellulosilyticus]GAE31889.1 stage IV sporulation protein B [Halalkalibacter hemicellulosilyticusJCM 9152]
MRGDAIRKGIGVVFLIVVVCIGLSDNVQEWVHVPNSITVFEEDFAPIDEAAKALQAVPASTIGADTEQVKFEVGNFPVKNIDVNVLPKKEVIPGGQSIGVKLNTEGVLVVGHHLIETDDASLSPGEEAGIEVGDMITHIDGEEIQRMSQVGDFVQAAGDEERSLEIRLKRDQKAYEKTLQPVKAKGEHSYRMGLYIRDSAAGVGTLTFYDPDSKNYGALGHVISDVDTKKPIIVHDGQIIRSSVTSIEKGSNGDPGEKLASLSKKRDVLGSIEKNSSFGIFGKLEKADLKNHIHDEGMPVSLSTNVKEGPAQILTVVEGEEVQEFDIEIISSVPQKQPATKGMVIKVTDPKLLEATGGIVQGMSGSPIIQDGKLVGAVTHVFVNDPTSGYGCHIEWMLEEAGVIEEEAKAS